jgi:hypothetical protein
LLFLRQFFFQRRLIPFPKACDRLRFSLTGVT